MPKVQAQDFVLPVPGVMVLLSPTFNPPILKGIKVHPDNPFHFDFILDQGDENGRHPEPPIKTFGGKLREGSQQEQLKQEATKGIKFHIDHAQLEQLQNASGFVPVIINIQPLTDIQAFLGLNSMANDNQPKKQII